MSNLRDAIVRMALRRPYLYLLVGYFGYQYRADGSAGRNS